MLQQVRKEAKVAQAQREERRGAAFGRQSLFGIGSAREGAWEDIVEGF